MLVNPEIIEHSGSRKSLWEGCISSGSAKAGLFAKVPRYPGVTVSYYDDAGKRRVRKFSGLKAQIIQHEMDHLNGILFVDRVKDTKTYMTYQEYMHQVRKTS